MSQVQNQQQQQKKLVDSTGQQQPAKKRTKASVSDGKCGSKGAQIFKRQIESKTKNEHHLVAAFEAQTNREDATIGRKNQNGASHQLSSVRNQRLKKPQWASTKHLYGEENKNRIVSLHDRNGSGDQGSLGYEQASASHCVLSNVEERDGGGGGETHQSARMRYFSSQGQNAQIVMTEIVMAGNSEDQDYGVGSGSQTDRQVKRHPKVYVEPVVYTSKASLPGANGDQLLKSKISSARNLNLRNSLVQLKQEGDAKTPALLASGQSHQSVSSQQLLYNLHSTKVMGKAVPGGPSHRYRSEQGSLVRKRPSGMDVNPKSNSSCGGDEASSSVVAMTVGPTQHQGRLLFKRQERNAGKPSQALHQVSQRQLLAPNVAAYYPAQDVAYQGGTSSTISVHQEMLVSDQQNQQQQQLSSDQNSSNSGHQQQQIGRLQNISQKGYMLGEQQKAALRTSLNHLVMGSPRSVQNSLSRHSKKVQPNVQDKELKVVAAEAIFKSKRSLRRVSQPDIINNQQVAIWSGSGVTKLPSKLSRASNSLGERGNPQSKYVLSETNIMSNNGDAMMNIKEEFSASKDYTAPGDTIKFTPTRSSIPIISTKHFLESGADQTSNEPKPDSDKDAKQYSLNTQEGGHLLSFDAHSNDILGQHGYQPKQQQQLQQHHLSNRNGSGSALHQHSSSVLPSHRHLKLLSSVNKTPSGGIGISCKNDSQLQHYGGGTSEKAQHFASDEVYQKSVAVLQKQNSQYNDRSGRDGGVSQSQAYTRQQKQNARAQYKHLRQQVESASLIELATDQTSPKVLENVGNSNPSYVSKVQQKNQQFKFQFRRSKNQQAKQQQAKGMGAASDQKNQPSQSKAFFKDNNETAAKQRLNSHRVSAPCKARPIFKQQQEQQQEQPQTDRQMLVMDHDDLVNVGKSGSTHDEMNQQKMVANSRNYRDQKLLSSASPPQSKRSGLQHVKQQQRGFKKQEEQVLTDGSDLSYLAAQVSSRARLQSVAVKPNSLSKKGSDAATTNEKMITSSQNSGGNISGLTQQLVPAQKPPNTPLKQSMQQMKQRSGGSTGFQISATGSDGDNSTNALHYNSKATMSRNDQQDLTSQKTSDVRAISTKQSRIIQYGNMMTKKRSAHCDSKDGDDHQSSEIKMTKRTLHSRVQSTVWDQRSSGTVTISQEESPSHGTAIHHQSLPSIINGRQVKRNSQYINDKSNNLKVSKHSRGLSHGVSHAEESATVAKVTSYNQQAHPSASYVSRVDSSERNFIIRASMQSASLQVNSHATSASRYDDSSQKFDTTTQTNQGNANETAGSFCVIVGKPESDGNDVTKSEFKGSQAQGAGGTAHYNDSLVLAGQPKKLSKTSSTSQFDHAYKGQAATWQGSGACGSQGAPKFKVEVYSDKHSANEITRLQEQIKERDSAYSSLKTQFEQLRKQVEVKADHKQGSSLEPDDVNDGLTKLQEGKNFGSASRIVRKAAPGVMTRQNRVDGHVKRTQLNGLTLIKQRSNSEAHLLQVFVPLGTINESSSNLDVNGAGELRKPTKRVAKNATDSHRTPGKTRHNSRLKQPTKFISKEPPGKVVVGERSVRQINQLLSKKKTSLHPDQIILPASQSPVRHDVHLSAGRNIKPSTRFNPSAKHTGSEVQLISADTGKNKITKFGAMVGISKAGLVKIRKQTEVQSTISLDKDVNQQASSSRKKLKKVEQNKLNQVKQPMSKAKTKQPAAPVHVVEFMDKVGGISKKVAIQNLKQALNTNNSTGKKILGKQKTNTLQQKSVSNKSSILEEEKQTISGSQQLISQNRFVCAGAQQQTIDTDQMLEQIVKRQESLCKEETPSNEQSQSQNEDKQSLKPATNMQSGLQPVVESSDFKVTGTAFGSNIDTDKRPNPNLIFQAPPVNVFGAPAIVDEAFATGDASQQSAAFPTHSETSQSMTDQGQKSLPITPVPQTAQMAILVSMDPSGSRCETPIHPNMVVDGIKFMDVQDPNYITSVVFDQCQDGSAEKSSQVPAQQQNAMNSTGKEFFAVKKQVPPPQQQQQQQQPQPEPAAVIVNKTSIEILKQLQKRKQGANGGQTQRKGSRPKVVMNPFTIASQNRSKQATISISQSQASTNNFVSSAEFNTAVIQHQQFTISSQANKSSEHNIPIGAEMTPTLNVNRQPKSKFTSPSEPASRENSVSKPTTMHLKNQLSAVSRPAETSMVSAEMFYSPMQEACAEDDIDEDDNRNIEIMPQFSNKNKTGMIVFERRQSEACTHFGKQMRNFEESSFQVSQIEHCYVVPKRDEILDDSLLLALQEDNPKGTSIQMAHLNDTGVDDIVVDVNEESNANLNEVNDQIFFAQQMALQPDLTKMTPIPEYHEQSNLRDIFSAGSQDNNIGDGLILLEQHLSNLSSEMAIRQEEASPGLKKQKLNSHTYEIMDSVEVMDIDVVENDNTIAKNRGIIQFTLTDQKEMPPSHGSQDKIVSRMLAMSSVGSGYVQGGATANKLANSGSKFTLTDMVQSNANLTYSEEDEYTSGGGHVGFAVGSQASVSAWTATANQKK